MLFFIFTSALTFMLFAWAVKPAYRVKIMLAVFVWIALQGLLAFNGFYTVTDSIPPRFIFAVLPTFLFIFYMIFFKWKNVENKFDAERLTYFHIVRIPVEIAIFSWYTQGLVPKLMTFEGINFDIVSGLTAFFIGFAYFRKNWISTRVYKIWNFICLGLLLNIVFQFTRNEVILPDQPLLHGLSDSLPPEEDAPLRATGRSCPKDCRAMPLSAHDSRSWNRCAS